MVTEIRIEGLEELRARFQQFPSQYNAQVRKAMEASLLKIGENIPSYPAPPATSTYKRTGTLGRSIGSGMSGGKPDIYEINVGSGMDEAKFGTRLSYAPYVIGEKTQAWMHEGRWWTLDGSVLKNVKPKIEELFKKMATSLAKWLEGRGL